MRALAVARLLWPQRAAVSLERLAGIADVGADQMGSAVALLCDEGMAVIDPRRGGVRLTERGARELLNERAISSSATAGIDRATTTAPDVV